MSPDRKKINWGKMAEAVQKSQQTVWDNIREAAGCEDDETTQCQGYDIVPSGFKNYPPRLEFDAHLILPEDKTTDARNVNRVMKQAAQQSSSQELRFRIGIQYKHPMMESLENDPVFGLDPKLPNGITYSFNPDRSQFEEH